MLQMLVLEGEGGSETDDDSDDDYGPTPAAGVWAGGIKLKLESEKLARKIPFSRETSEMADQQRLNARSGDSKKLLSDRKLLTRP